MVSRSIRFRHWVFKAEGQRGRSTAEKKRARSQIASYSFGTFKTRFGRAFSSRRTSRLKRSDLCFITLSS